MLFDDTYKTIANISEGIYRDRGSKFIAYAYPVHSEAEVKSLVQTLRNEHSKARHFCWAMRLTPDRSIFKIQDDGEPSGTAGRPILNSILSADLTNILIVVVRYFGGTLLGVPGLINAYKSATVDAIANSVIINRTVNDVYEVVFDYLAMNDVMRIIKDEALEVIDQSFDNECNMRLSIRKANLNRVLEKLEKIDHLKVSYLYSS